MVIFLTDGNGKQYELMVQKHVSKTIEVPPASQWQSGGGGITDGKFHLYGYQNNRIHSPFISIKPNETYTLSIANLKKSNFYFSYYLIDADQSVADPTKKGWLTSKTIDFTTTNNAKYIIILIGSDDLTFGPEALNSLVKCDLKINQAVEYATQSDLDSIKADVQALKNKIEAGKQSPNN